MKTLIFVRHGEAGHDAESDFKRGLTPSGKSQAEKVAMLLLTHQLIPSAVLCSSAVRTRETCEIICKILKIDANEVQTFTKFYSKGFETYIDEIIALDNSIDNAMIVGHNPAISQLVNYFCKDEIIHMKPGTMVAILFDFEDWNLIFTTSSKIILKSVSLTDSTF
jgi:phosphohistidine phosphatase